MGGADRTDDPDEAGPPVLDWDQSADTGWIPQPLPPMWEPAETDPFAPGIVPAGLPPAPGDPSAPNPITALSDVAASADPGAPFTTLVAEEPADADELPRWRPAVAPAPEPTIDLTDTASVIESTGPLPTQPTSDLRGPAAPPEPRKSDLGEGLGAAEGADAPAGLWQVGKEATPMFEATLSAEPTAEPPPTPPTYELTPIGEEPPPAAPPVELAPPAPAAADPAPVEHLSTIAPIVAPPLPMAPSVELAPPAPGPAPTAPPTVPPPTAPPALPPPLPTYTLTPTDLESTGPIPPSTDPAAPDGPAESGSRHAASPPPWRRALTAGALAVGAVVVGLLTANYWHAGGYPGHPAHPNAGPGPAVVGPPAGAPPKPHPPVTHASTKPIATGSTLPAPAGAASRATSARPSAVASHSAAASPTARIAAGTATVTVLNETGIKGLAEKEAAAITAAGWNVRRTTNVNARYSVTTVFYERGQEGQAALLLKTVPSVKEMRLRPNIFLPTGGLIVVVASDAA